jgi:hypothetical protein
LPVTTPAGALFLWPPHSKGSVSKKLLEDKASDEKIQNQKSKIQMKSKFQKPGRGQVTNESEF